MKVESVGPHDYEELSSCPFCNKYWNYDSGCPHFVVGFQDGAWATDLCSPLSCSGHKYHRERMLVAMTDKATIVCKRKPGTRRHAAITAYFSEDPVEATTLRRKYRQIPINGPACAECGNTTATVINEREIVCEVCGCRAYLPEGEDE